MYCRQRFPHNVRADYTTLKWLTERTEGGTSKDVSDTSLV